MVDRDSALERLKTIREQLVIFDRDTKKLLSLDSDLKGFNLAYKQLSDASSPITPEATNFARFLTNRARKEEIPLDEAFKKTVDQINKSKLAINNQKARLDASIRKEVSGWYPESYLDLDSVDFVIKELEEYRADSIKEAVQHLNQLVDATPLTTSYVSSTFLNNNILVLIAFVLNAIVTVIAALAGVFVLFGLTALTVSSSPVIFLPFLPFLSLFPLFWMIPMTWYSYKIYKGQAPNTLVFAICDLLFLNLISGVLLIVSAEASR